MRQGHGSPHITKKGTPPPKLLAKENSNADTLTEKRADAPPGGKRSAQPTRPDGKTIALTKPPAEGYPEDSKRNPRAPEGSLKPYCHLT